jgi:MFS family permease
MVSDQVFRAADVLPKTADYIAAFKLLSIPAIPLAILATALRHGGFGIQGSFYVVYLEGINISGTSIGMLVSVAGLAGCGGALLAGRLSSYVEPVWLMLSAVGVSILMLAATPLLGSYSLLVVAACLFGGGVGISQPLEISLMGKAAGSQSQGKAIGLRMTATRMASFLLPIIMGAIVEVVGLEISFFFVGAGVVLLLALARLYAKATLFKLQRHTTLKDHILDSVRKAGLAE